MNSPDKSWSSWKLNFYQSYNRNIFMPLLAQIYYPASIANWDPFAAVYNFVKIEKLKLGKIPNPLKSKEGADLEKRTRHVNLHFRVTPEEKEKIQGIMKEYHCNDFGQYARRMLLAGHILILDWKEISNIRRQIAGIATNINQIAFRVNATHRIYYDEIRQLQNQLTEIFRLLNLYAEVFEKLDDLLDKVSD